MDSKQRVLIIDDERMIRETLRMALEDAGYDVTEADHGSSGLDSFRRWPPDLVITDIIMPEKEGIETIVEMRKERPEISIIAMSGGGRTSNLDFLAFAKKLGANEILAKPFGPLEIVAAIERVLGKSAASPGSADT